MHTKKTKIVATIGPASANEKVLGEMIKAGLNVIRINFSHGDFAEHEPKVKLARELSRKFDRPLAVMQDLSGPKFRLGDLATETVRLEEGEEIVLTSEAVAGTAAKISLNYPNLAKEVRVGGHIMLNDGRQKLEILEVKGEEVRCRILVGGEITSRRSVNLPGARLSVSSLTDKDKKDLDFAVAQDVDWVAFSFVRSAADVRELRSLLEARGSAALIVAKIETHEAVENFDTILAEADGIMVARGDLAVEIPAEDVPLVQKMIIKKCNEAGKPVITATQMLESMVDSSVPTRAEVSDIANAILDGTDAIMLSEETTLGKYPVEAVKVMAKVALRVERDHRFDQAEEELTRSAKAAHAKCLVVLSDSVQAAQLVVRRRPALPVIVLTTKAKTANQLALSYGCFGVAVERLPRPDETLDLVREQIIEHRWAKAGDKILVAGAMSVEVI